MRLSRFIIKGGLMVGVALVIFAGLCAPAFGYAGIVKIHTTNILTGVSPVHLVTGAVDQNSTSNLTEGVNYLKSVVGEYTIYDVYDAPASTVHFVLLKSTTHYRILSAGMGTTVPPTTTFTSPVTFYVTGPPVQVQGLEVVNGFETAKASWTLSPDYDYSSVKVQVATDAGFTIFVQDETLSDTTVIDKDPPFDDYAFGELVDGRVLTPGTDYWIRVIGTVKGEADSPPADKAFATNSAGVPPLTFNIVDFTPTWSKYMISMPYNLDYADGKSIAEDINTQLAVHYSEAIDGSNGVFEVDRYNPATQQFESVYFDGNDFAAFPPGPAFDIVSGEGYIVYTKKQIMGWTPKTQ